LLWNALLAKSV